MGTKQYNLPEDERPREKLIRDPSGKSLSDAEFIAILLNTGTVGCPVSELAHRLLCAFPSLEEFVNSDWLAMKARVAEWNEAHPDNPIKGAADAKLLRLAAAFQFVRRVQSRISADEFRNADASKAKDAAGLFRRILAASPEKEHFFVLPLNSDLHALCEPLDVSQGSVSRTPVHPRDVFCEAVRYRAYAVIVAHNHDHLVLGSPESAQGMGFVSIRNLATLKF